MSEGGFVKTDARSGRWEAHRQARRVELIQAAVRAIHRKGPRINMNDVAASAKVSKPVLYRHFADQRELYHAVGSYCAEWLVAWLAQHLEPDAEPADMIAAVVDAYLGTVETQPQLYRFCIRHAFADETTPDAVDGYRSIVVRHVEAVLRAKLGSDRPTLAWSHGLVGLAQSIGEWWLDNPDAATRRQLTQQVTELIWSGLSRPMDAQT